MICARLIVSRSLVNAILARLEVNESKSEILRDNGATNLQHGFSIFKTMLHSEPKMNLRNFQIIPTFVSVDDTSSISTSGFLKMSIERRFFGNIVKGTSSTFEVKAHQVVVNDAGTITEFKIDKVEDQRNAESFTNARVLRIWYNGSIIYPNTARLSSAQKLRECSERRLKVKITVGLTNYCNCNLYFLLYFRENSAAKMF
jgi:hypothetical protein